MDLLDPHADRADGWDWRPMLTLLRPEEIAVRLGVSRWTVYDLARRGVLPVVRIGRSVRFDPEALDRFVAGGGASADRDEHRLRVREAPASP